MTYASAADGYVWRDGGDRWSPKVCVGLRYFLIEAN